MTKLNNITITSPPLNNFRKIRQRAYFTTKKFLLQLRYFLQLQKSFGCGKILSLNLKIEKKSHSKFITGASKNPQVIFSADSWGLRLFRRRSFCARYHFLRSLSSHLHTYREMTFAPTICKKSMSHSKFITSPLLQKLGKWW